MMILMSLSVLHCLYLLLVWYLSTFSCWPTYLLNVYTVLTFLPLAGLNKNLKTLLGEHAEFHTLTLKDTLIASDGTKKVVSRFCKSLFAKIFIILSILCSNNVVNIHLVSLIYSKHAGGKQMLFTLEDGLVIETVVIPSERGRNTVCVSSQVGCAMNCQFCYTGRQDL